MSTGDCPICGGSGCKTYPLMLDRYAAGHDREHWRRIHDRMNGAEYPSLAAQAGNAIRAAAGFAASGFATVDRAEQERRMSICRACPNFDAGPGRCRLCGCLAKLKARIARSSCPDSPPRW